jgi:hypothetical protein
LFNLNDLWQSLRPGMSLANEQTAFERTAHAKGASMLTVALLLALLIFSDQG